MSFEDEKELLDAPEDAVEQVPSIASREQSPEGLDLKRKRVEDGPSAICMHEVSF